MIKPKSSYILMEAVSGFTKNIFYLVILRGCDNSWVEKFKVKGYAKDMLGFSKKRFFITLGGSVVVWGFTAIIQAYITFAQYLGTFSSGCQVTGYPIDVCALRGPNVPSFLVILFNITIWFFVIHLFWKWFDRRRMPSGK